jgi:hypothetical protein
MSKLSELQKQLLPKYAEEYRQISLSTERCDRQKADQAFKELYKINNMQEPTIEWFDSPLQAQKRAAQLKKGDLVVTDEEIRDIASSASYGSLDSYWVAFHAMNYENNIGNSDPVHPILMELCKNSGVYWTLENTVVASEKPTAIHIENDNLHNNTGPALTYANGDSLYCIEGKPYASMMDIVLAKNKKD